MPSSVLVRTGDLVQPGARSLPSRQVEQPSSLLWSPTALGRWASAVVVGLVIVTGAWFAVGGQADWDDQRPYMSLAIATTVLVSFGGLSLLLAGRRRIGLRRLALLGDLPLAPATDAAPTTAATVEASSPVLVASDGRLRYHRADCQLAVGKGYTEATAAEHAGAGRMPCGVCLP